MFDITKLKEHLPSLNIRQDVPYKTLTTLGAGATLPYLAEVSSLEELSALLAYINKNKIAYILFGAGSNLVGMDEPFDGIGIILTGEEFTNTSINKTTITVGSSVKLPLLARNLANNALGGISPLAGIPASIGGAVRMNAGASGASIGMFVKEVYGITTKGQEWFSSGKKISWSYRNSSIPKDVIITKVVLELKDSTIEVENDIINNEVAKRKANQPQGRSAGCTFKNPSPKAPAGKLIDQCNLKGLTLGGFEVSNVHANFIINTNGSKASDYYHLVDIIKKEVYQKTNYKLSLETLPCDIKYKEEAACSPTLLNITKIFLRLAIFLAGAFFIYTGILAIPYSITAWPQIFGGLLLILVELILKLINKLENI